MFFVAFLIFWFFMFFYQCRSEEAYTGRIDMKEYTFCSSLVVSFPRWLIRFLFFNARLTKLPLTIVVGQIANYGFLAFALFRQYICHIDTYLYAPLLKIWCYSFVGLFLVMIVDHEIYCAHHKSRKM